MGRDKRPVCTPAKRDGVQRARDTYEKTCEILKLAKLLTDVSPAFTQLSQPFYTFRTVSVHLTLLLSLTPTLFAPFISHLAGYCDKRITRFSPRENVFLAVYYT